MTWQDRQKRKTTEKGLEKQWQEDKQIVGVTEEKKMMKVEKKKTKNDKAKRNADTTLLT